MRRIFFRLMHQDLNAILDGLRELEHNGVETLDCRRAQFSAEEPIARLRMICQSWKVMFHAEYSSGQPVSMLVDLRAVVEAALAKNAKHPKSAPTTKPAAAAKTRAQAAGAAANSDVPDFEVAGGSPDWSENTPTGQQDVDNSNPK
jgi:hypothetical protein